MVSFLLDNSLGAWWAGRYLSIADLRTAKDEDELREKARLPGVPLEYLRFVKKDDETWVSAAGTFDAWPKTLKELKSLDPCCGSGHFLIAVFLMLVPMRMELEKISARVAVDAVLRENIHGLEIDQRCVELAAFALALTAWKYPDSGGYRSLPPLNLACSGLSVSVARDEWKQLGLGRQYLSVALGWLYDEFKDAPVLGSLLNPAKSDYSKLVKWGDLLKALEQPLGQEKNTEQLEIGVVAHGLAKAATLLTGRYHWVITNVPYLLRRKQTEELKKYIERYFSEAKNDLATVFLERCLEFVDNGNGGTVQIVMPQNWLFLVQHKPIRKKLLLNHQWELIARLGAGAFNCISGEVVNISLFTICHHPPSENHSVIGIDVSAHLNTVAKANGLSANPTIAIKQQRLLNNVDSVVAFEILDSSKLLSTHVASLHGLSTTDTPRFTCNFWEVVERGTTWIFQIGTMKSTSNFGGRSNILRWEQGKGALNELRGKAPIVITGLEAWGKSAVAISQMGELASAIYNGDSFLDGTAVLLPKKVSELPAIYAYCSSNEYRENIRRIDKSIKIVYSTLAKVPFDFDHWEKIATSNFPNGLPKPYSDDPTQWIFHGHPCGSVIWDEVKKRLETAITFRTDETVLQISVAHLLGYQWPAELDENIELDDHQREWLKKCKIFASHVDDDGIACIPPVRGEASASERLLNLLSDAYGSEWSNDTLAELLKNSDHGGKSLETWLRDKFFSQHCKIFQNR
ncbi:MAG: N-6 DNA methylase, partial [Candidatus Riflebacteria bacterium]|nr:N-6 DNA methylase [Candidatus Riflebacteria bacterium]